MILGFYAGKSHNLIGLGIFHGDLDFFDLHEKSLDLSNYEIFPHKILKSRTFKKSNILIVIIFKGHGWGGSRARQGHDWKTGTCTSTASNDPWHITSQFFSARILFFYSSFFIAYRNATRSNAQRIQRHLLLLWQVNVSFSAVVRLVPIPLSLVNQ